MDGLSIRAAAALCVAYRWAASFSLVLTLCALIAAPQAAWPQRAVFVLCAVLGAVLAYLAVRIEFDRAILAHAAQDGFDGFDEALARLGWRGNAAPGRSVEARVAGVAALVRKSAMLLVVQLALAVCGVAFL